MKTCMGETDNKLCRFFFFGKLPKFASGVLQLSPIFFFFASREIYLFNISYDSLTYELGKLS